MSMRERLDEINKDMTKIEHIDEIIECLNSLYCVETSKGIYRLPHELSKYSCYIGIALSEAKSLKEKLLQE